MGKCRYAGTNESGSGRRVVHYLLRLPVPVHLLAFAVAAGRHHHRDRMRESGLDAAVGRLTAAHALEPVVRMSLQIVALMDRWDHGLPGKRRGLRFALSCLRAEHHVGLPGAHRLLDEPPLRTALTAGGVQCASCAANDRMVAIAAAEGC